ncbi:MAG: NAD(P)-binding domain-containing protein [Alphaproteobacteria bacterium]
MVNRCEVAVVGAGPYGLSLAAHLRERGVGFRIFGRPLDTWWRHMPEGMMLKSDGFATNLSAPAPNSTLAAYCAKHALPYRDQGLPVPLSIFLAYAENFRARFVPDLEETNVARIERAGGGFTLALENGETLAARHVVLAVGISWYAYTPPVLAALPRELVSHSFDHREFYGFRGKNVAVIGAGASAVDVAHALAESGASPRIVARAAAVRFNDVPGADAEKFPSRLQRPASGIGRGWKSYFCAAAPLLFYRLPRHLKERAIASHMHPAGGWFMRDKVEGNIPMSLSRAICGAEMKKGLAVLALAGPGGAHETLSFDHVIAATGFWPDLRKLPFLAPDLAGTAAPGGGSPELSDVFETRAPGLYALGLNAMESFGPLMRFMVGAEFAAPRLAAHLERKMERHKFRRAA